MQIWHLDIHSAGWYVHTIIVIESIPITTSFHVRPRPFCRTAGLQKDYSLHEKKEEFQNTILIFQMPGYTLLGYEANNSEEWKPTGWNYPFNGDIGKSNGAKNPPGLVLFLPI